MIRVTRELLEAVLLALIVFFLLQISIQNFKVEGSSMKPTLEEGQYLLVNKLVYMRLGLDRFARFLPFRGDQAAQETRYVFHAPQRGEVIVFRFPRDPSRDFVKRVIGVPGDSVEVRQGRVYVNGLLLTEPYITQPSTDTYAAITLGEDEFYVLGDNRRASNDSRDWGPLPMNHIIGKVWVTYWPLERFGIPGLVGSAPSF